jgi:hypothetical protein
VGVVIFRRSSRLRPARRGEVLVEYGVSEYTLVFRRVRTKKNGRSGRFWVVARPSHAHVSLSSPSGIARHGVRESSPAGVAPVFVVPICSTLGLDKSSYEAFLLSSGILDDALRLLSRLLLRIRWRRLASGSNPLSWRPRYSTSWTA